MTKRKIIFRVLGFAFSVIPPLVAAVELFPLLTVPGKVSAGVAVAIALSCVPFFKQLKRILASPAAWMMWGAVFLFCLLLRPLIDEFYVISMLGFAGNVIGAIFFRIAKGGDAAKQNGGENHD